MREVEKNRSVLAKSRNPTLPDLGGFDPPPKPAKKQKSSTAAQMDAWELYPEQELTPQQIQMFEKENQDMLRQYEDTLDQVKYATRSTRRQRHSNL